MKITYISTSLLCERQKHSVNVKKLLKNSRRKLPLSCVIKTLVRNQLIVSAVNILMQMFVEIRALLDCTQILISLALTKHFKSSVARNFAKLVQCFERFGAMLLTVTMLFKC
jgi:hypothetical protein